MNAWRDRLNQFSGQTPIVVCRLFLHLAGDQATPLLGTLNRAARNAMDAEGDLETLGEGLVEICEALLQYDTYWQSAANEGDVLWDEGEAEDYVTQLFTDSAQRYVGDTGADEFAPEPDPELSLPITHNLVVMLTVAFEGEAPELQTDLAAMAAMKAALTTLVNLHYQGRLRAVQVHFSPAQLGDELTAEQLLLNFPELIPL
jgi:hypothetical protein